MAAEKDFVIEMGKTFSHVLRWEAPPYIYKAITAITKAAPVRITAASHGLTNGWRVAVVSVNGMIEINALNNPPKTNEYKRVTVIDSNTVELNEVNSAGFKTYTSGGYLQFLTPVDMAGFTARMSIKDRIGGTELLRLDTTGGEIVLDNANKTITLTLSAAVTEALEFRKGVYDLELESGTGVVTALLSGKISVSKEVTTT